jgi:hypothetical protein
MTRTCEDGCNGCDECTDYDDGANYQEFEFGCCLPPGECCMPGLHFPIECHTAADYERMVSHAPPAHQEGAQP